MMILAETHQKMGEAINRVGLDMHGITGLFKAYNISHEFDNINRAITEIQSKLSIPEFHNLRRKKSPTSEVPGYIPEPPPTAASSSPSATSSAAHPDMGTGDQGDEKEGYSTLGKACTSCSPTSSNP